ncbi:MULTISPECIES: hypothetical protein [unclassified Helicobacter]|uniref:hypothetical protein n=1 Tax=unclassified Helicobacter TaxID=2593540 RepID=UPI00115FC515|nr:MULTISPECIES: hypothetical protein [unclassified Helicobacter]
MEFCAAAWAAAVLDSRAESTSGAESALLDSDLDSSVCASFGILRPLYFGILASSNRDYILQIRHNYVLFALFRFWQNPKTRVKSASQNASQKHKQITKQITTNLQTPKSIDFSILVSF